jgi:hypothetical protein
VTIPALRLSGRQALETDLETMAADAPAKALPEPVCASDVVDGDAVVFSVAELMTAGDYGLIGGEDGSMKTTIATVIAAARAGGHRVFGRFETLQCRVLIVSEEDSAEVIVNRIRAICRGHGWSVDAVLRNVFIFARCEVRLGDPQWVAWLHAKMIELDVGHVTVDPYVEVATGDENSATDGRVDLQTLRSLTIPTGANVVLVHHFSKPVEGKRLRDRFRGTSSITSGSRYTYAVQHNETDRELAITCVKLSRGEKLKPFVVRYTIESEPLNRGVWTSARFDYATMAEVIFDRAEAFVLEQLANGQRMNTTELKVAAKGTGVSGADIARSLKVLEMRRLIDFEEGAKGSKQWGLIGQNACLPENPGNHGQPENLVAGQPECLPGNHLQQAFCLPTPLGGQASSSREGHPATRGAIE